MFSAPRQHTSNTTKLSPSFPHLTTLSSLGFSNILAQGLVGTGWSSVKCQRTCRAYGPMVTVSAWYIGVRDCKLTKSLELLEPELPALFESMATGVARRAILVECRCSIRRALVEGALPS